MGSLPSDAREDELGRHFAKYGQVLHCSVHNGDKKGGAYGFTTFKSERGFLLVSKAVGKIQQMNHEKKQ